MNSSEIQFEDKKIRVAWDAKQKKCFFAVPDIVQALTNTKNTRDYIQRMLQQDSELKSQWGTICANIEILSSNGKASKIIATDFKGVYRILESISSEKKDSFRQWLLEVDSQKIGQIANAKQTSGFTVTLKSFLIHLPQYALVAIVPLIVLIYQENSSCNGFDYTDDFASLYTKDTTLLVEDSTVLFLDISKCKVPVKSSRDSSYSLITDRQILVKFLGLAKKENLYKFIFIDISFDKNLVQPEYDLKLKMILDSMYMDPKRVLLVEDKRIPFNHIFDNHCLKNSFIQNKYGMFLRSILFHGKENSVAVEMLNAIDSIEIKTYFFGLLCDGQIFMNNPITKIIKPDVDFLPQVNGLEDYMLSDDEDRKDELTQLIRNKIIIIGDFKRKDDRHATYAGTQYGPYLTYCIYKSLSKGLYKLPNQVLLLILLIYFLLSVFVLNNKMIRFFLRMEQSLTDFIYLINNPRLRRILDYVCSKVFALFEIFIKFGVVYILLHYCTNLFYVEYDYLFSSEFPILYFTAIEVLYIFINHKKIINDNNL